MSDALHALAAQALNLDAADRLRLAAELIDSVEGPADPDWTEQWRQEIRRRSDAADQREVRGQDWSEVRASLLRDLTRR